MRRARKKKLRLRDRRRAERRFWRSAVMQTDEVHSLNSVRFFTQVETQLQGPTGIVRSTDEWERRAAYGGRKGRKAKHLLAWHWRMNRYDEYEP